MKEKRMNKKILVSCIGAAAIIVLTSFNSVVGNQNTNLSGKQDSPLFNIRMLRATNKPNQDTVSSEYIGKGKTSPVPLPTVNNKQSLFLKAIDIISTMDEATFNKFLVLVINNLHESSTVNQDDITKIIKVFHQLRENPDKFKRLPINEKESELNKLYTIGCPTVDCATFGRTPIFCLVLFITFPIWYPIVIIFRIFANITYKHNCLPTIFLNPC